MKYYEVTFHINASEDIRSSVADVVAALAGDAGFESFETTADGLCGYVQQDTFDATALDSVLQQLPFGDAVQVEYDVREADQADWNAPWEKEGFQPVWVSPRLVIHDGVHLPSPTLPEEQDCVQVEIDAKLAFGTGNHQTTRLMCAEIMSLQLEGKNILDCGTGTGVLSIVALLSGAAHAVAYDIDDWSTINAMHNAVLNHVDDRMTVFQGDASILQQMDERFNLVVANINRNVLLSDMPLFRHCLDDRDGVLLLSGFYQQDTAMLRQRAAECGLMTADEKSDGDWALMKFVPKH